VGVPAREPKGTYYFIVLSENYWGVKINQIRIVKVEVSIYVLIGKEHPQLWLAMGVRRKKAEKLRAIKALRSRG
jgi:hypothetical protein